MRILVDADACPVKDIIVRLAKRHNISVIMLIDTAHEHGDGDVMSFRQADYYLFYRAGVGVY
jgi:uncharacterized protein YaiI (UPF0178 family)